MEAELAAKLDASICPHDERQPVHLSKDLAADLLEQRARVADTLGWLRQYLTDAPDLASVPARECWNRLCSRYFDPNRYDPDEMRGSSGPD